MTNLGRANTTTSRGGVFISYARSDGEAFAARLRERLEAEGVRLWQDRVGLEGGRDWWLQITEALDRVEFMVLVMTPNALGSDTVKKEWRYARQQGVCVYPVKGSGALDFGSLPRWMRDVHFYDLGALNGSKVGPEWKKFVNDLNTRCQARRVPFMVEDMPEDFVERPGEFERLLSLLLDQREEPVAITAALRGAGGYGKTTLARALCHDERVQDAFDDGVLWVTLGETPGDLTGRVEDLIYTLSDKRPGFTGIDAATAHLSDLLADRDIILVIDDVWNGEHLRPFMQGGPRCARLVTTRNADTLPATARNVDVDAMRQDEAVALLGAGLEGGDVIELRRLAARLGEWPLLLKLVNGTLRERVNLSKQRLPDAVTYVKKALDKRGLTFFDARNPASRAQAVSMTLGVSLEQLDEGERERYGELAVFPEDADVPLRTLTRLWGLTGGLDEFDTEELCARLSRLSLLLRFDLATNRIRLHDVVRSFLMHRQGTNLPALHRQLLDAHRPDAGQQDAPTPWCDMPTDEPYVWDNLAYHLTEAELGDELVATVKDLRYLAAKAFLRKSLPVEQDLLAAESHATDDKQLQLLRRAFVQSGHLLNRCDSAHDADVTMLCRLQHLPELSPLTDALARTLTPPYIIPRHQLHDLPHPALIRTINAHDASVKACALSPDGSYIVSASVDGTLKVWETKTGSERLTLNGHTDAVNACVFSPDGSFIVSASNDRTLKVWDAKSGAELRTLAGHEEGVRKCAVSPDGSFIVSASGDETLKIWDARSGGQRFTLVGHAGSVSGCAISSDGSFILSASEKELKVWDAKSGRELRSIEHGDLAGCAVSPEGSFFVSASYSTPALLVFDAESGEVRHTLVGHSYVVYDFAVSEDGSLIVSASIDGTVRAWDAKTGDQKFRLVGHSSLVNACAISRDGSLIVSASDDKTLKLWDVASGGIPVASSGHTDWVSTCEVSRDSSFAVTTSWDATAKVWDAESCVERFTLNGLDVSGGCAISSDGAFILTAYARLRFWDANDGRLLNTVESRAGSLCAISPDGSTIDLSHNGSGRVAHPLDGELAGVASSFVR